MKKFLSLVICLAMVLSFAVVAVSAEETGNDTAIKYLMFASDRHGDDEVITNILSSYPYGTQVEYVGLDGDMVDGFSEYDVTAVAGEATQIAVNATVQIMYGSHDKNAQNADGILYRESGMLFDGDGYCVYGITFDGMGSKKGAENAAAEADEFKKWVSQIDPSEVIFVLSHKPMHALRGDNQGAIYWHEVLNDVATDDDGNIVRNIIFFHGHNHTEDGTEYMINAGDTMTIASTEGDIQDQVFYTYVTAGYLKDNQDATMVAVTDASITLEKWNASGVCVPMVTITRVLPDPNWKPPELPTEAVTEAPSETLPEESSETVTEASEEIPATELPATVPVESGNEPADQSMIGLTAIIVIVLAVVGIILKCKHKAKIK